MQLFVGVAAHLEAEVLDGGLRDLLHVLDHLLVPLRLRGAEGGSRRELMCCGGVNTSRGGVGKCAGLLGQLRHVDITHDCGVLFSSAAGRGASGLVAQQKCGTRGGPSAVRHGSTPLVAAEGSSGGARLRTKKWVIKKIPISVLSKQREKLAL